MRMRGLSLAAIAVVIVAACGGGGGDSGTTTPGNNNNPGGNNPGTNPNTVTLVDSSFSPATITVKSGSTVTWQWPACTDTTGGYGYGNGNACITHQILFDDGSGTQSAKQDQGSFNRTFSSTGTFKYHCVIHGSAMSGQVVVQ